MAVILLVWGCTNPMNKRILNTVLFELSEKRQVARLKAEARKIKLYSEIPALESIDNDISSCGLKLMKASIDESLDYETALENIKKETENLRTERRELLSAYGYSEDVCEPVYECKKCDDKGYKNGTMCECLKRSVAMLSYKESGLGKAFENQSFDNFSLSYYLNGSNNDDFKYMSNLFSDAKKYAYNFSGKGNLLMIGNTGLGKTHLSSAIAKEVIKKGYTVVYETAQNIFDLFEDKKFGRAPDANTQRFLDADLLIIDDLGTEHITSFTISVLYNLINERTNNCKSMIISTNLSPDELKDTYKPRIFSRLLGDFKLMQFKGKDIRLQKLGE